MAQSQTAEAGASSQAFDPNRMPLPEPNIYRKIENTLAWWNEPAEHKYTLGELFRKVTFREPARDGFHASRIGRLAERIATITGVIAVCALGPANIGFFPMLIAAKIAGVGIGGLVAMPLSKGLEGMMRKLGARAERNQADTDEFARKHGLVGATELKETPVGARPAPDMKINPEDKIGASRTVDPDATIKQSFDTVAADSRAFDPTRGAKPLETYGLGTAAQQKKAASGPGQKNGG